MSAASDTARADGPMGGPYGVEDKFRIVLGWSQRLEQLLKTRFGATGAGLGEQWRSVQHLLDEPLTRALDDIAWARNKVAHESGYSVPNLEAFDHRCATTHARLLEIQPGPARAAEPPHRHVAQPGSWADRPVTPRERRSPSFGLVALIVLFPLIGALATLRRGYGERLRGIAFAWLVLTTAGVWIPVALQLTPLGSHVEGPGATQPVASEAEIDEHARRPRTRRAVENVERRESAVSDSDSELSDVERSEAEFQRQLREESDDPESATAPTEPSAPSRCDPLEARARASRQYGSGDACAALATLRKCCPDRDAACRSLKEVIGERCR